MSRNTSSLYHPFFTEEERRDLELVPHDDLTGEIYLQRYLLVLIMSKSPPGPLDFELLLEKTRTCNLAIHSLISLIYAELELRKGKKSEWESFVEEARYLAAIQLGITDQAYPPEEAAAIRSRIPPKMIAEALSAAPEVGQDTILPYTAGAEQPSLGS